MCMDCGINWISRTRTRTTNLTGIRTAADEPAPVVYGCAVRIHALRSGTHTLRVRITVSLPAASRGTQQSEALFSQQLVISVIEPLLLLSSGSLILPPGSSANVLTNIQPQHNSSVSITYSVVSYSCRAGAVGTTAEKHVPFVAVDERGAITVRERLEGENEQAAADAVVLVQSTHDASSTSGESVSPVTQSQVVLVSVRPIAQLFVSSGMGSNGAQLLCPARNYSQLFVICNLFVRNVPSSL